MTSMVAVYILHFTQSLQNVIYQNAMAWLFGCLEVEYKHICATHATVSLTRSTPNGPNVKMLE